jgi:hypothetical protein
MRLSRIQVYRVPATLLVGSSLCFVFVNASYAIVNWSEKPAIKSVLHKIGPMMIVLQIVLAFAGSLALLLGSILLVRILVATRLVK